MAKKIKLDSKNYRKHSTENQEMINKSLRELGAGRSVLMDNEDELSAGNETYTQAQKLGLPIKIVESDGKTLIVVKRTDLATDDEARKQLAIVDNLASDKSEFDFDLLKNDFEIDFLQDVGFTDFDLSIEPLEPEPEILTAPMKNNPPTIKISFANEKQMEKFERLLKNWIVDFEGSTYSISLGEM